MSSKTPICPQCGSKYVSDPEKAAVCDDCCQKNRKANAKVRADAIRDIDHRHVKPAMDSYLKISNEHYNDIRDHAAQDYPNLCCGILLGEFLDKGASHTVTAIVPCTNVHLEPTQRFHIALEQLAQIAHEADAPNEEIVGFYCSYSGDSEYSLSMLDTYRHCGIAYVAVWSADPDQMSCWKLIGPENSMKFVRQTIVVEKEPKQEQSQTRTQSGIAAMDRLNALIGLPNLKAEVRTMVASVKVQQARKKHGMKTHASSLHMVFTGNPGTGKTTVARLIAEIYRDIGVLSKGHLVDTDRSGLVSQWVGGTALKTTEVVQSALGGVLFIDEAYSLMPAGHGHDFAAEAVAMLLKLMEDYRDDLVVILAGYPNEMQTFIETNPGLASRFNKYLHFEDYTAKDLADIFEKFCTDEEYVLPPETRLKVQQMFEAACRDKTKNFANGRLARNGFEQAIARQHSRIAPHLGRIPRNEIQMLHPEDIPFRDDGAATETIADKWCNKFFADEPFYRTSAGLERFEKEMSASHEVSGEGGGGYENPDGFAEAAQAYDSELTLNPQDAECRSKREIALFTEELEIDWTQPTLRLDIGSWWREPINYRPSPGMRCFNFVCELEHLPNSPPHARRFRELEWMSDNPRDAGKEITVYRRSRATAELWELGDGLLLDDQKGGPLILEVLWAFPEDVPDEECIRKMADNAYETIAYDHAYGNVILFLWP